MNDNKFSELVRQQRKRLGLTQEELAKKLYVTNKAVSRWETGKGYPDIKTLTLLIKIFGLHYEEVFDPDGYIIKEQKKQQRIIKILIAIVIVLCAFSTVLLVHQNSQKLTYQGKDLFVSEELLNSQMDVKNSGNGTLEIRSIRYTSDIRNYLLKTLKVDDWEFVSESQWIAPYDYGFSFFMQGDNVLNVYIVQEDTKISIYINEEVSQQISKKYQVDGDIKGKLVENMNSYTYESIPFSEHQIENNSAYLEEIEQEIVWNTWDISLQDILLNTNILIIEKEQMYIIIGSKDRDINRIDTKIKDNHMSIYMEGEETLLYQPYLHVYKINSVKDCQKIYFNNSEIPIYSIYID